MSLVIKDSTRLLGNKGTPCSSHWEREAGYSTWKQTQKSGLLTVMLENCVKVGQDRKTQIKEDAPLQGECSLSLDVGRYTIPTSITEVPNPCQLAKHLCILWSQWRWEKREYQVYEHMFLNDKSCLYHSTPACSAADTTVVLPQVPNFQLPGCSAG